MDYDQDLFFFLSPYSNHPVKAGAKNANSGKPRAAQVQDIYLANEFASVSQGGRLRFLPAGLAESSQLLLRRDNVLGKGPGWPRHTGRQLGKTPPYRDCQKFLVTRLPF